MTWLCPTCNYKMGLANAERGFCFRCGEWVKPIWKDRNMKMQKGRVTI